MKITLPILQNFEGYQYVTSISFKNTVYEIKDVLVLKSINRDVLLIGVVKEQ